MDPSKPDLFLLPAHDAVWGWYCARCEEQYNGLPLRSDKMVFVGSSAYDEPLAGCVLIHTDGPYLMANWVIINDIVEPEDKYNAAVFLQDELKKLSLMLNRIIMVFSNHQGLSRAFAKHGFNLQQSELWYFAPANTYVHPVYESHFVADGSASGDFTYDPDEEPLELGEPTRIEPSKKRGRPKGSKNKRTLERERNESGNSTG